MINALIPAKRYIIITRTVVNYRHNRIDDGGELGGCRYVWIKDDITDEMLSKDELAIARECADEAYGDFNEKLTFIKGEILELSIDCYWEFCTLV